MMNRVSAPGLECRRYSFHCSDDCLDLCDALSSFNAGGKISLHELCRALVFPGKPDEMHGGDHIPARSRPTSMPQRGEEHTGDAAS